MVQSVLGSITLGYRPLWGRSRELAAVQLRVAPEPAMPVDAPHLLRTLDELWTADAPPLLLSAETPALLADLLEHGDAQSPQIEVPGDWLAADAGLQMRVFNAHRRGLRVIWRGDVRHMPPPAPDRPIHRCLLSLQPEDAAAALQAALQQKRQPHAPSTAFLRSPVQPGHYYENIASAALIDHCLDQKHGLALLGWPDDDVLYGHRGRELAPARSIIERLLRAIGQDQSMDVIEDILSEEPILSYRFLTLTNSAALGLRTGIDSLRRGLMMMGYTQLERWLVGQLPHAGTDLNLQPVRLGMVLRARLMEHILDAGIEDDLRREVYLCGLFSQLDVLMNEPLGSILHRLPLSERIYSANVTQSGPYLPALELARAIDSADTATVRALRHAHELDTEDLNRALLHTLLSQHVPANAATRS